VRTIVCTSLKGGSGKSTIVVNLAVEAERQGLGPVAIADTDSPQGSASHWWNIRDAHAPLFARELEVEGIELLVVDTAPQVAQDKIIRRADFVIIPVRPSPNDLRAVGETISVVEKCKKPFCFVVNGVKPRATITGETVRVLEKHGAVAPVLLGDRVDFAVSMIDGLAVSEMAPASRSAREIAELWKYVDTQMRK
jgi:chromosome partitioning protein